MGDPLLTPAIVGATVSPLIAEVIGAAKGAIHIKGSCKPLMAKVDRIEPLLREASADSANWSEAHSDWLHEYTSALQDAKDFAEEIDYHQMMYWLDIATAPGSATLITTRISPVLSKVHAEVEDVLTLSSEESWKLSCWYAFQSDYPPSYISEKVARDLCKECQGLPLALRVIGSAMADKMHEEEWRSALHDLREAKPMLGSSADGELYGRLRLSYDELKDDVTKRCFLYRAAFPEDYEIPVAHLCHMWIAEGIFGAVDDTRAKEKARAHVEILVKRAMITCDVRKGRHIQLHDVRDLANFIIDTAKSSDCAYDYCFHVGKQLKPFPSIKALETVECLEWPMSLDAPSSVLAIRHGA